MKRDMDLIRAILSEVESAGSDETVTGVHGWETAEFAYNVWLMEQAGLVVARVISADDQMAYAAYVFGLTWDGHDFLDAVRSDSIWAKTKAAIADVAGSTAFDVLKQIACAIALKTAMAHLTSPA
jgi:hypothetical protein